MIDKIAEAIYLTQYPNGSFTGSVDTVKNQYRDMAKVAIKITGENNQVLLKYMDMYAINNNDLLISDSDQKLYEEINKNAFDA
jgi:hypothetical protein